MLQYLKGDYDSFKRDFAELFLWMLEI